MDLSPQTRVTGGITRMNSARAPELAEQLSRACEGKPLYKELRAVHIWGGKEVRLSLLVSLILACRGAQARQAR